jgi:hypothetical protein
MTELLALPAQRCNRFQGTLQVHVNVLDPPSRTSEVVDYVEHEHEAAWRAGRADRTRACDVRRGRGERNRGPAYWWLAPPAIRVAVRWVLQCRRHCMSHLCIGNRSWRAQVMQQLSLPSETNTSALATFNASSAAIRINAILLV